MSRDELIDKFWSNIEFSQAITRENGDRLLRLLEKLEELGNADRIVRLLVV
jgi:hypothetical protein